MIIVRFLPPELKARLEALEFIVKRPGYRYRSVTTDDGVVIEEQRFYCADCLRPEPLFFMVHRDLWERYGIEGILCWECFEKRVGRPLTNADLIGNNDKLMRLLKERSDGHGETEPPRLHAGDGGTASSDR